MASSAKLLSGTLFPHVTAVGWCLWPGDYHSYVVASVEFDTYKKATGSKPTGGFGGSTGRFSYQRGNSSPPRQGLLKGVLPGGLGLGEGATPGPRAYDVARDGAQTARKGKPVWYWG